MKKGKIALFGIVGILLMFVVFIPIKAEAAAIIKAGKTIALKNPTDAPLYKLTLEEDALLKVEWCENTHHLTHIDIYCDSKKQKNVATVSLAGNVDFGYECFALKKGVYYIVMADGYGGLVKPSTKVCFSWTPMPEIDKGNYCAAKAIELKANKTTEVVQTPRYNSHQYYKITLTKERKIQLKIFSRYIRNITILSEDLSYTYDTLYVDDNTRITEEVLAPGTYYFWIYSCPQPCTYGVLGEYWTFKWK